MTTHLSVVKRGGAVVSDVKCEESGELGVSVKGGCVRSAALCFIRGFPFISLFSDYPSEVMPPSRGPFLVVSDWSYSSSSSCFLVLGSWSI
jgi:hypothetical protein